MWQLFQLAGNPRLGCVWNTQVGAWESSDQPLSPPTWDSAHDFAVRCECGEVGLVRFDQKELRFHPDNTTPHWRFIWRWMEGGLIGWTCGRDGHRPIETIRPLKTELQLFMTREVLMSQEGMFVNPFLDQEE